MVMLLHCEFVIQPESISSGGNVTARPITSSVISVDGNRNSVNRNTLCLKKTYQLWQAVISTNIY